MSIVRKITALVVLPVLLIIFISVSVDAQVTPNINPYEYGTSPEHLYVFLYRGYKPVFGVDIDTTLCTKDRLYVFNTELNTVTEISGHQYQVIHVQKNSCFL